MSQRASVVSTEDAAGSPMRRRSSRIATGTQAPATAAGPAPVGQRRSSASLEQPAKITKTKRLSLSQETCEERPATPRRGQRSRAGSSSPTLQVETKVDMPAKRGRRSSVTKTIEEENESEVSSPKPAANRKKSIRGQSSSPTNTSSEQTTAAKPRTRRGSVTEKATTLASIDELEQSPDRSKNHRKATPARPAKIDTIEERENEEVAAVFGSENKILSVNLTKLTDLDKVKKKVEEEKPKRGRPPSRTGTKTPTLVVKEDSDEEELEKKGSAEDKKAKVAVENVMEKSRRSNSKSPSKEDAQKRKRRQSSNSPLPNLEEKSKSPLPTTNRRRSSKSPALIDVIAKKSVEDKGKEDELQDDSKSPLQTSPRRESVKSVGIIENAEKRYIENDLGKSIKDKKLLEDTGEESANLDAGKKMQEANCPLKISDEKSNNTADIIKDTDTVKKDIENKSVEDGDNKSLEDTGKELENKMQEKSSSPLRTSARIKSNKPAAIIVNTQDTPIEDDKIKKSIGDSNKNSIEDTGKESVEDADKRSPHRSNSKRKSIKSTATAEDTVEKPIENTENKTEKIPSKGVEKIPLRESKQKLQESSKSPLRAATNRNKDNKSDDVIEGTEKKSFEDEEKKLVADTVKRSFKDTEKKSEDNGKKSVGNASTMPTEDTEKKSGEITGKKIDTAKNLVEEAPNKSSANETSTSPKRRSLRLSNSPSLSTGENEAAKSSSSVKDSTSSPQRKSQRLSKSNEEIEKMKKHLVSQSPTKMKDLIEKIEVSIKNKSNEEINEDLLLETEDELEGKKKLMKTDEDLSEDVLLLSDAEDAVVNKPLDCDGEENLDKKSEIKKKKPSSDEEKNSKLELEKKEQLDVEQKSEKIEIQSGKINTSSMQKLKSPVLLEDGVSTSQEKNVEDTIPSKSGEPAVKSEPDSSNRKTCPAKDTTPNFKSPKSPGPSKKNTTDPLLKNEHEMSLGSDDSFHLNLSIAKTNSQESLTENILKGKEKFNTSTGSDGSDKENLETSSSTKKPLNVLSPKSAARKSLEMKNIPNVISPKSEVVVLTSQTSTPKISSIKEKIAYDSTVTSSKGTFEGEDTTEGAALSEDEDDVFAAEDKDGTTKECDETKLKKVYSKEESEEFPRKKPKISTENNEVTSIGNKMKLNCKEEFTAKKSEKDEVKDVNTDDDKVEERVNCTVEEDVSDSEVNCAKSDNIETEEEEMEELVITNDRDELNIDVTVNTTMDTFKDEEISSIKEETMEDTKGTNACSKKSKVGEEFVDCEDLKSEENNVNSTSETRNTPTKETQNEKISNSGEKKQVTNDSGLIDSTSNGEENSEESVDNCGKTEETINPNLVDLDINFQNIKQENISKVGNESNTETNYTEHSAPSEEEATDSGDSKQKNSDKQCTQSNEEASRSNTSNPDKEIKKTEINLSNGSRKRKREESEDDELDEEFDEDVLIEDSDEEIFVEDSDEDKKTANETTTKKSDVEEIENSSDDDGFESNPKKSNKTPKKASTKKESKETTKNLKKEEISSNSNPNKSKLSTLEEDDTKKTEMIEDSDELEENLKSSIMKKSKSYKLREDVSERNETMEIEESSNHSEDEDLSTSKKNMKEERKKTFKGEEDNQKTKESGELKPERKNRKKEKMEGNESEDRKKKIVEIVNSDSVSESGEENKKKKKCKNNVTDRDNSELEMKKSKKKQSSKNDECRIDDLLASLIDKKMAELNYSDEDKESEDEDFYPTNEFIDDQAFEGEEDTPSEGSNDIVEQGESLRSSDTEDEDGDDDDYEDDSFIADDESVELLPGDEYDIEMERKTKKKKSRIIKCSDSEDEDEETEEKNISNDVKLRKNSRIIQCSDSEDEEADSRNKSKDGKIANKKSRIIKFSESEDEETVRNRSKELDDDNIESEDDSEKKASSEQSGDDNIEKKKSKKKLRNDREDDVISSDEERTLNEKTQQNKYDPGVLENNEEKKPKKKRRSKVNVVDLEEHVLSSEDERVERKLKSKVLDESNNFDNEKDVEIIEDNNMGGAEAILTPNKDVRNKKTSKSRAREIIDIVTDEESAPNKPKKSDINKSNQSPGNVCSETKNKSHKASLQDDIQIEKKSEAQTKCGDEVSAKPKLKSISPIGESSTPLKLSHESLTQIVDCINVKKPAKFNSSTEKKQDVGSPIEKDSNSSIIKNQTVDNKNTDDDEDAVISIADSEPEAENIVEEKKGKVKIIQDIKISKSVLVSAPDKLDSLEDLEENPHVKNYNTPSTSFADSKSSRRKSSRKTSISFQEKIKVTDNANSVINEKITKVVDFLCSSIQDNKGNLSLNVSLDYANSSNEDDLPIEKPTISLKKEKAQEMRLKTVEVDLGEGNVQKKLKKKKKKDLRESTDKKKKRDVSKDEGDGEEVEESSGFSLFLPKKSIKTKEAFDIGGGSYKQHKVSKKVNLNKEEEIEGELRKRKRLKKNKKNIEEEAINIDDLSQHNKQKNKKNIEEETINIDDLSQHNKQKNKKNVEEDYLNQQKRSKKSKKNIVEDLTSIEVFKQSKKSKKRMEDDIKELPKESKPKKRSLQDCFTIINEEVPVKKSKKMKSSENEIKAEKQKRKLPQFHILEREEPLKKKKKPKSKIEYLHSSVIERITEKPTASTSEMPCDGMPKKKRKKNVQITPSASVMTSNWNVEEVKKVKKLEEVKSKLLKKDFRNQMIYDTSRNKRKGVKSMVKK